MSNKISVQGYAMADSVELSYGPLGRLAEMRDWLGATRVERDALGRATKTTDHDGNEVGYSWDALGRREALTYPDGGEARYIYTSVPVWNAFFIDRLAKLINQNSPSNDDFGCE